MRTTFSAVAALAAVAGAQSTTSIDIAAIEVAIPTSVFVLPVIYVTAAGAPTLTATTLATTATASSDPKATNVFDSAADVSVAISSASELAAATATPISRVKRDVCVQQPLGISHGSVPDTAAAFAADGYYSAQAIAAGTPTGYVQSMSNLNASNSADQYLGYTLVPTYDVANCMNKCTAIDGCNSVNIYFERSPTVNPDDAACSNPASTVQIKCVFWGGAVVAANANNFGQWRGNFQVLIAGSNGYMNSTYAAKLAAQATATSSSSSAAATATNAAGNIYTIYYSSDSTTGAYSNAQAASSYTDCTTACDADSQCNAFTYVGGANGVGSGTCWLKTSLGSPSSSGKNFVSGTRSGKASSSSSSTVVSTTSSIASSSSKTSSSTTVAASSTTTVAASSTTTTAASSTTTAAASSTTTAAVTTSTTTKASTTSSSTTVSTSSVSTTSSSTTSASSAASTGFYIVPSTGAYSTVASGLNGTVTFGSLSSATKFQISSSGYLVTANGNNIGYAASLPKGVTVNQQLVFNPTGTPSKNYVSCSLNEKAGWLECNANGQFQQAYVCSSENYKYMYFGPTIPGDCIWIGLYRTSA